MAQRGSQRDVLCNNFNDFSILYLFSDINKSSTNLTNKGDVFYSSSVQISRRQIKLLVIVSSLILKLVDITVSYKRNNTVCFPV